MVRISSRSNSKEQRASLSRLSSNTMGRTQKIMSFLVSSLAIVASSCQYSTVTLLLMHSLQFAAKIPAAEATWYSEICSADVLYKVRMDPISGELVQVTFPVLASKNKKPQKTTISGKGDAGSNFGDGLYLDTESIDTGQFIDDGFESDDDDVFGMTEKLQQHARGDQNNRVLRSNRIWRDLGETESDALVINGNTGYVDIADKDNHNKDNDPTVASSFPKRFLESFQQMDHREWLSQRFLNKNSINDDDANSFNLQEGEFFVKPCMCESSRWTFPDQVELPESSSNETSDTLIQDPFLSQDDAGSNDLPSNPKNWGQFPNGLLAFIPPGDVSKLEEWDDLPLYLCNERAMYCGVPVDPKMGVKCYEQNMRHIIARNAWPLILLWYFGLAIICCCTVHGRTAGDYVVDRLSYFFKKFVCCFWEISYDFNDRMLNRMIEDDERESRRRTTGQDDDSNPNRPWFYSNQRRMFERALLAQVQWIWRHQEYLRELELREAGLPPPQIKLKVKRFSMTTTTSGSEGGGFLEPSNSNDSSSTPAVTTNASIGTPISTSRTSGKSTTPPATGTIPAVTSRTKSMNVKNKKSISSGSSNNKKDSIQVKQDDPSSLPLDCGGDDNNILTEGNANDVCEDCNIDNGNHSEDGEPLFVTVELGNDAADGESDVVHEDGECCQECIRDTTHDDDGDSIESPTCTICFCPFEEGDRIGDLPCRHEFHVDCLKGWLQRKNSCPLCNARLGRPERPEIPSDNSSVRDIDASHHSISSLINRIRMRQSSANNRQSQPQPQSNGDTSRPGVRARSAREIQEFLHRLNPPAGEIHRGSRVGLIGSVSAAEDIVNTVSTRRNFERRSSY